MRVTDLIRPEIANLESYSPVASFEALAEGLGCAPEAIIKLDANENPYGPPPCVIDALAGLTSVHLYPDPECADLRRALAERTGVPVESLLVGAGSDELLGLISRLFLRPGDVLLDCPPTFSMYAFFAEVMGARVVTAPRREDFSLDFPGIEAAIARESPKLLFVASPNNPDGGWLSDGDLERLLALPLVVVLDEAYIEFADGEGRIGWVAEHENLIVVRTFSKWAGLAGLRIGYGAFPEVLLPHVMKIKEPYTVSAAAQAAALAVLRDPDYGPSHRQRVIAERERMTGLLQELPFLEIIPSQANFLFCRVLDRPALEVKRALETQGILVRTFSKPGMEAYLRIGVGRPDQTDVLVAALRRMA
jgi:histidinol-phosphate aminotransferase